MVSTQMLKMQRLLSYDLCRQRHFCCLLVSLAAKIQISSDLVFFSVKLLVFNVGYCSTVLYIYVPSSTVAFLECQA